VAFELADFPMPAKIVQTGLPTAFGHVL